MRLCVLKQNSVHTISFMWRFTSANVQLETTVVRYLFHWSQIRRASEESANIEINVFRKINCPD